MAEVPRNEPLSFLLCCPFKECTLKVQDGKFKLQDLLVVPMQRVLKYHLLLKVSQLTQSQLPLALMRKTGGQMGWSTSFFAA